MTDLQLHFKNLFQLFTTWVQKWTADLNCGDTGGGDATTLNTVECSLVEFAPSIAITLFNMTLPVVFGFMLPYEGYKSNAALTIHLARCIILRLASLVVTAAAIKQTVSCDYYSEDSYQVRFSNLFPPCNFNFELFLDKNTPVK